jgi:hypothetical protein
MANLKLQNQLSALSIGSPDLALTHQASSAISVSQPSHSRFFVIKSYTEEDLHKAVKYLLWSSTTRGNLILDAAYRDVEEIRRENEDREAEVYLFFSVNKSKHFQGVARITGPVDHSAHHTDLWRQSAKWPGSISIEWVTIKDVPNNQFIHIENPLNENKPACQGRDCQEIYPKTGEKMLTVFRTYVAASKLFDDFMFYDEQERLRSSKKAPGNHFQPRTPA